MKRYDHHPTPTGFPSLAEVPITTPGLRSTGVWSLRSDWPTTSLLRRFAVLLSLPITPAESFTARLNRFTNTQRFNTLLLWMLTVSADRYGIEIHHDGTCRLVRESGSSSSFTVGLLHALHALQQRMVSPPLVGGRGNPCGTAAVGRICRGAGPNHGCPRRISAT